MLSLSLSMSCTQRLEQRQVLSLQQRLQIEAKQLQIREDLVSAFRGENFRPSSVCSGCGHRLTTLEILAGFTNEVTDYMTTCPRCKTRIRAVMKASSAVGSTEILLYCAAQTIDQLQHRPMMVPDEFRKEYAAAYYSALYHFGSLRGAYKKANMDYPHQEKVDWREKAVPFLGKLPDKVIASYADVPSYEVSKLRKSLGIGRFYKTNLLDD